jgi:hypothetical protein
MKRVLLLLVLISPLIYGQEILQRNNASGINYSLIEKYTAVKFTANDNYTVGAIEIQAKYNKLIFNSNQWIYGNIYDDNGNKPGKQIIQGISSKVTAIPSVFWQVNMLTNAILNKNTVYWLVIRLDFASPENSLICNSDTMGQGAISRDGITWTVNKVQLNVIIKGRPYNPPVQGNTEASQATKIISLSGDMTKDNSNNVLRLKRDLYGPYIASGDLLYLQDNSHSIVAGAAFIAEIDSVIRIKLNPRAQGGETAYKFDTKEDVAGNLLEIAKKGVTKIKADSAGIIDAGGFTIKGENILDSIKSTNDSLTVKFNEYAKTYDTDTAKSNLRNEINGKFNKADTLGLNAQKFSMIADSLARNSLDINTNKQSALDSIYNHITRINAQYDSLKSHNLRLLGLIDSLKKKVSDTDTSGRWQPKGVYAIPGDTLLSLAYLKAMMNYKLPSADTNNFRGYSNYLYQNKGIYLGWADTSSALAYVKLMLTYKLSSSDTNIFRAFSDAKYMASAGTVTSGAIPYFSSTTGKALGTSDMYWDAVNGRLGIGTSNPETIFDLESDNLPLVIFAAYGGTSVKSAMRMRAARGTKSSPSAIQVDDYLFSFTAQGYNGTTWSPSNNVSIYGRAAENFTSSAMGAYLSFETSQIGTNTRLERMRIGDSGKLSLYDNASTPVVRFFADPNVADGASAVAYSMDTKNNLQTSGAKLLSIRNGGTEKAYVNYNGYAVFNGIASLSDFIAYNPAYFSSNFNVRNKANSAWLSFATRNTTGTEAVYDLSNVGTISASSTVTAAQFSLSALNTAPASSTATGTTGEIRIVDGFIYVCVSANSWKRAALSSW